MKKFIASVLLFTVFVSGCSLFKKPLQEAVNEGISGFADAKKMSSSLSLSGTVQAPPGEKPARMQFSFQTEGKSDISDEKSPKIDVLMKLQASFDEKSLSAELKLRTADKKMFVNVEKIDTSGETDLKTQLAEVLGTWWILPIGPSNPFGQLLEEQRKLQEKFKTADFFTNAKEDGTEELRGEDTTRYRVDLDKEALKKFILDMVQIAENKVTPEEEGALNERLKDVTFSGAVWIGDDDILHRIKGTVTITPTQGATSSFDIDYEAWDFEKDVSIVAPESPKEFNPLILLPLIGAFSSLDDAAEIDLGTTTPTAAK